MGLNFLDQYTYLHFASGLIAYFWGLRLKTLIISHIIFEIIENTQIAITLINKYIYKISPMRKNYPDSYINRHGDTIGAIIGWLSAYYLDKIGNKYQWYKKHIN